MDVLTSTLELDTQMPIPSQQKPTDTVRGSKKRTIHDADPDQPVQQQ